MLGHASETPLSEWLPDLVIPITSDRSIHRALEMKDTTKVKKQNVVSIPPLIDSDTCSEGVSVYKYRDFNRNENVMELEEETRSSAESPPPPTARTSEASIRVQRFPAKLYAILAQKEFNEIITWMPHGRSVSPLMHRCLGFLPSRTSSRFVGPVEDFKARSL